LDAGAVLSDRHTLIMRHTDLQYTNGFRRPGFLRRHEFLRKCARSRAQIPSSLPPRSFAAIVNPRAGVVRQSCLQGEYCRDDRTNAPKSVVYAADGAAREPLDSRHLIAISF